MPGNTCILQLTVCQQVQREVSMSERADALADNFATANTEFVSLIESVPDDKWDAATSEEQWSIGVVAHHVALGYPSTFGAVQMTADAGKMPDISWDQIHASNAKHAEEFSDVSKAETIELLKSNGAQVEAGLRTLTDDQLDVSFDSPVFGGEMTVEQLVNGLVIGHIGMHSPSIEATIDS